MSLLDEFVRCTHRLQCPVCGRPDWCLVSRDDPSNPSKAICARVESPIVWGEAGWLHVLRSDNSFVPRAMRLRTLSIPCQPPSMAQHAEQLQRQLEPERLNREAIKLSVSRTSLVALGIGWVSKRELARLGLHGLDGALAFPMCDANQRVIGIRLRLATGRKLAVPGSKNGLFLPRVLPIEIDQLLITEGETDCAALLDLGLAAVGRPGCTNGTRHLERLVHRLRPHEAVVVTDNDDAGHHGAHQLALALRAFCPCVRVIHPPEAMKDARDWKRSGATTEEIRAAIECAEPYGIELTVQRHGVAR